MAFGPESSFAAAVVAAPTKRNGRRIADPPPAWIRAPS
jgi:hypothetical protein